MADVIDPPKAPIQTPPAVGEPKGEALFDNSLEAFRNRFSKQDGEKKPAQEPKKEDSPKDSPKDEQAKEVEKPVEIESKATKPSPTPSPKRTRRTVERHDLEKLAVDAAAKASAEVAARMAPKPDPVKEKPAEQELDLPDEVRYKLEIIGEMEAVSPKHKGKKEAYTAWLKEADVYQRKWESEHPDEEFDPEDKEHDAVFKREPAIPERDYDLARVRLLDKHRENKELSEQRKELSDVKAKLAEQEIQPEIVSRNRGVMGQILGAIDADYAKAAGDLEKLDAISKDDPDGAGIAMRVASTVLPFVTEVVRLWHAPDSETATKYNDKNEIHREIVGFARKMEEAVSQLPESDQVRQGKAFVTMAEWLDMPDHERGRFWSFLDKDALLAFKVAEAVHVTKAMKDDYEKRLEASAVKRGYRRENAPAPPKKEEPTPKKEAHTPPPAGEARHTVDTSGQPTAPKSVDFGDTFLRLLRGNR